MIEHHGRRYPSRGAVKSRASGCGSLTAVEAVPVLDVHGLRRVYGDFVALDGLELTVNAGECVAVLGHNGSGKTTAMRLIAGLLEPSDGSVRSGGVTVDGGRAVIAARGMLAMVPDAPSLYDDLTTTDPGNPVFMALFLLLLAPWLLATVVLVGGVTLAIGSH
jgi:ABC-type glutathione transport system ATPase component